MGDVEDIVVFKIDEVAKNILRQVPEEGRADFINHAIAMYYLISGLQLRGIERIEHTDDFMEEYSTYIGDD